MFGEVYIWSTSKEAKLSIVDAGKPYERQKLNERPIYLRSMLLCLGFAQAFWHLYHDYDRVQFPDIQASAQAAEAGLGFSIVMSKIKERMNKLVPTIPLRSGAVLAVSSIAYGLFLRQRMWSWTFVIAKTWHSLPKNSRLAALPPQLPDLVGRSFMQGILLILLWEFANLAFDIYVTQPPLKKAIPLTEGSKDPNHSLVAGLKAKKEVTRVGLSAITELITVLTRSELCFLGASPDHTQLRSSPSSYL